jgi:hypothetical protein
MTINRLTAVGLTPILSLKGLSPAERLEWANSNNHEVNAERARSGLFPIKWVLVDGHLKIHRA